MALLILIGMFLFPIFTLGCVLFHHDHPLLGFVAILISLFKDSTNAD